MVELQKKDIIMKKTPNMNKLKVIQKIFLYQN